MVSKASEDLPDPDRPVITISLSRGSRTSMDLRLCSLAPRMTMSRAGEWLSVMLALILGVYGPRPVGGLRPLVHLSLQGWARQPRLAQGAYDSLARLAQTR